MGKPECVLKHTREGGVIPGIVVTILVILTETVLGVCLVRSKIVPTKYIVPTMATLLLMAALVGFLTHRTKRHARFIVGVTVSVILVGVLIYGIVAFSKVTNTLNTITTMRTEVADVCVYVLTDDPAETLNDLRDDTFGILAELDRSSTDGAITQINDSLGAEITTFEYESLSLLIDALYRQDCRAIILNSAYLDVLEEMDGYEDIAEQIRKVSSLNIEEVVEGISEASKTPVAEIFEDTFKESAETTFSDEISDKVFTVYISGIDSRNGLIAKSRSNVNIIATVNTDTHQVLLVTTPRDYYVEISISNGAKDKLTHAGIYGINVSMETLEMLYDIDLDYFFKICFDGVKQIVDALGGVTVYSEYAFTSLWGYTYEVGYNYLNGGEALSFARERYSFASGDRQRGKNQMELIKAMIDKAISPSILTRYNAILTSVEGNFETSLPYDLIAELVNNQLANGRDWDVITYSVDGSGSSAVPYSMSMKAYVMIPDEATVETAKKLMQAVLDGETITQP